MAQQHSTLGLELDKPWGIIRYSLLVYVTLSSFCDHITRESFEAGLICVWGIAEQGCPKLRSMCLELKNFCQWVCIVLQRRNETQAICAFSSAAALAQILDVATRTDIWTRWIGIFIPKVFRAPRARQCPGPVQLRTRLPADQLITKKSPVLKHWPSFPGRVVRFWRIGFATWSRGSPPKLLSC